MSNLVKLVEEKNHNPNVKALPEFRTGDTINVGVKIKEGDKSRVQYFSRYMYCH